MGQNLDKEWQAWQNFRMEDIKRQLLPFLNDHVSKKRKSLLLLGPRQTGKSCLLKSLNPDISINLAKESEYQKHLKNPALIEQIVIPLSLKKGGSVFIDEIQRIPEMMNTVQSLIDDHKNIVFLLSGSSPRKLKKKEINLLPGRIFSHQLFPLSFWELKEKFDLDKCLSRGSLPEIYTADYGPELLSEYIDGYLREEIMAEALVKNVASFSRFIDLAAAGAWQELNYSKWASDSEIPKETIRRYMDILSETLLIHRIPGFTDISSSRKAIQKEKFLFFDIGVRNGILGIQNNQFTPDILGHLFEQWIVLQVLILNSYKKKKWNLFYYRDEKHVEVDLIIAMNKKIMAIEIKWSDKYKSSWRESLDSFADQMDKRNVEKIILYRGNRVLKDGDTNIIPFEKFLTELDEV
jgi:predicted AAA+ superfamily ATPase